MTLGSSLAYKMVTRFNTKTVFQAQAEEPSSPVRKQLLYRAEIAVCLASWRCQLKQEFESGLPSPFPPLPRPDILALVAKVACA